MEKKSANMSSVNRGTVVVAASSIFMGGRCRDREFMSKYPGGHFLADLADESERNGFIFTTIDEFLEKKTWPQPALLVSDMGMGLAECKGYAVAAVLFSLESPIFSTRFFHLLQNKSADFKAAFLWGGCKSRVSIDTTFHQIFWPNESTSVRYMENWNDRKFAVMVIGNKLHLKIFWRPRSKRPLDLIKWLGAMIIKAPRTLWIRFTDPWMENDLSMARRGAIKSFGLGAKFDLYGPGWEHEFKGTDLELSKAIKQSYRGSIPYERKLETISKYRFALCFENMAFPGYITEKIFDAFYAGTIPVYYGATDISSYIPEKSYIDASYFSDWGALIKYLEDISEKEALDILEEGKKFFISKEFDLFNSKKIVCKVVESLIKNSQ
jgi:hypothetical protein